MTTNEINANGVQIQTLAEITEELKSQYREIYGQDITLDEDTADGNKIAIEAQAKSDILEYSVQVYNAFNVDAVSGSAMDQLYKLNNIYRKSAEYSFVEVDITTTKALTLDGLDDDATNPDGEAFTVSDNAGNQWLLLNTTVFTGAETKTLGFRAKNLGQVLCSPNTIQTMTTVVGGVSTINNPASQYITGGDEESDADFRIRRNRSTTKTSKGFQDSLESQLLAESSITFAKVYTNNETDEVELGKVWTVVEGGTDAVVANIIYQNMTMGTGTVGDTSYDIVKDNGTTETIYFDRPVSEPLFIKARLVSKYGKLIDVNFIKQQLVQQLSFGIGELADKTTVSIKISSIDDTCIITDCEISKDGVNYYDILETASFRNFFTIAYGNLDIEQEQPNAE